MAKHSKFNFPSEVKLLEEEIETIIKQDSLCDEIVKGVLVLLTIGIFVVIASIIG